MLIFDIFWKKLKINKKKKKKKNIYIYLKIGLLTEYKNTFSEICEFFLYKS